MKTTLTIMGIVFATTLAMVMGSKLSNETVAIVVGMACGLGATIPMTIALVLVANSRQAYEQPPRLEIFIYTRPNRSDILDAYTRYGILPPVGATMEREIKLIGERNDGNTEKRTD